MNFDMIFSAHCQCYSAFIDARKFGIPFSVYDALRFIEVPPFERYDF